MELFALSDREPGRLLAVTDADEHLSCGDLSAASEALARAIGGHVLVFLLCENTPGTLLGYLGCLRCGAVPLLLDAHIAPGLLKGLAETYRPAFYYAPCDLPKETRAVLPQVAPVLELHGSLLLSGSVEGPAIHPDLALLLTTSGSTGSPKLVRLSGKNLDANARSIAEYLNLGEDERPITTLPMSYSYGMSIVNSHLLVGAPLLLTRHSVMERSFWDRVDREGATSLAGVPYTYQMFHRLGLISMNLPRLRTLTQAGGKLSLELHREFAAWAMGTGRQFFVMYGQTEAAPRMGYLPANRAVEKCGSMGVPIPGGSFWLEDADGAEIKTPDATGELVYRGDNVAMGYAQCAEDLSKGDEWGGLLRTGDMAYRDRDGFYYIVGRKKRFVKLFGNRVNLDEVERLLTARFPDVQFACVGRDDLLGIYTVSNSPAIPSQALMYLAEQMHLPSRVLRVYPVAIIPQNEAGKTLYTKLPIDGPR